MTNKITGDLFTNAAFTRAFRASLKNPSQKVVYNKTLGKVVSWKVGNQEFTIGKEKMHAIRSCFLKIGHKLRMHCSYQYCRNYKKCVRKFETAQFKTWPEKVAKEAKVAHQAMRMHAYYVKDLPEQIVNQTKAIAKCQTDIEAFRQTKQYELFESQEMKNLMVEKAQLEELKGSLEDYIKIRMKKQSVNVIDQGINLWNQFFPTLPIGEEIKLSPQLTALASQILDPIPLNVRNPLDSIVFKNKIEEKINEKLLAYSQIMNSVNLDQLENDLRVKQMELQRLQNEQAHAPKNIDQFAHAHNDTKLLLSPPQSPLKAGPKKIQAKSANVSTLPPMETFLNELKKISSPQMHTLWESLLSNLVGKYGQDVVRDCRKNGKNLELTFKQPLKLFMLACDSKGNEQPKREPEGGSVLNFDRVVTFSAGSKNLLNITGLKSWARIPKQYEWAKAFLGEYAQVALPRMETKRELFRGKLEDLLTITAFRQVSIFKKEIPRTSLVSALKKHWKEHGEVVPNNKTEVQFLSEKRADLIRRQLIVP